MTIVVNSERRVNVTQYHLLVSQNALQVADSEETLIVMYSKSCLKRPISKRNPEIVLFFQDPMSLNAGQKYRRMLQGEHSAILSTFIKLPFVIKMIISLNAPRGAFCNTFDLH